jgi:hypothetical protein
MPFCIGPYLRTFHNLLRGVLAGWLRLSLAPAPPPDRPSPLGWRFELVETIPREFIASISLNVVLTLSRRIRPN